MIDTHAHLDALEAPERALDRARAAGVTRVITIGTGIDSCRRALELTAHDGVYAALGIDPHQAATGEAGRVGELRALLDHPRAIAVGEAGLDYHYGGDAKDEQRSLFSAQLALAAELGLPVVVHTRAANADTEAMLRAHDGAVVMHCFSEPELLTAGIERGWYFSFAGNATYPKAEALREAAAAVPGRPDPRRDGQPLSGAAARPGPPERACERRPHRRRARRRARRRSRGARGPDRCQRGGCVPLAVSVRPKKQLGQHFLADENILGVIERLAELDADDVVLEIGPGLGVLTGRLADRARHVHAVELDRSLASHLAALAERPNVELHWGDALQLDLAALDPTPTKLVSNLPYNVATPIVVESLAGLPGLELWTVMVQREVADRFFAAPSTKAYGGVSVLVQLASERTGFHPVARTVFRPPPNVDSALVAFRRRPLPDDFGRVKRVVEAAFSHRRKTLPNSLALAGLCSRAEAAAALASIGRPPEVRAEALAPPEFVTLAGAL